MVKTSTTLLRETLKKRDELYRIPYWRNQIPVCCPPVLWFGDQKRDSRIVTVGLNPSYGEFFRNQDDAKRLIFPPSSESRFYVYSPNEIAKLGDSTLTNRVIQSYNEYFRKNPYTRWFGKLGGYNIECFINQLDASFYDIGSLGCVHIDLFPFVTVDKFSDLDKQRLVTNVFNDPWFSKNFKDLVDFLDPRYLIVFGRSTTEYFNTYFGGSIRLNVDYRDSERKYASYGMTTYAIYGKQIPVLGLSVNLGNPRGFTKTQLSKMGRTVSQRLETGKQNTDRSLPFLKYRLPEKRVKQALSHENNHELAQVGDAVLSLVIREHYYKQKISAEKIQCKNKELGNNDYLANIAVEKLKLQDLIPSSSGLRYNPDKNEVYARTLEAIIGAIYQDNKIEAAREFIDKWIIPKK